MAKNIAQRPLTWILILALSLLMAGCVFHRQMLYTPDIALTSTGQPCIRIPQKEASSEALFDVWATEVFRPGVGYLRQKYYFSEKNLPPTEEYLVHAGECLRFDYHFQDDTLYSIGFTTSISSDDKSKKWDQKNWARELRLKRGADGTVQLMLDVAARDGS